MKKRIESALKEFRRNTPVANAQRLFCLLGYQSKRQINLEPNNAEGFMENFEQFGQINSDTARIQEWCSMDLLFQLTEAEIADNKRMKTISEDSPEDESLIQSYLFFLLRLNGSRYNRGQLKEITREINKVTPMPAVVIFQYGMFLALAVTDRRPDKRDSSRDVLEKIYLVDDIDFTFPDEAHVDILLDLSLRELSRQVQFHSFAEFHRAWQNTLDSFDPSKLRFSKSNTRKHDMWPSKGLHESYTKPYKIIPELFGMPYEAIFHDEVCEIESEQHALITSMSNGRYTIV
jgi:hypothetical protein